MSIYEAALDARISGAELRVLIALEFHYNATSGVARPNQATLGRALGCSQSLVSRRLRRLAELGYVVPERRGESLQYGLARPARPQLSAVETPPSEAPPEASETAEAAPDLRTPGFYPDADLRTQGFYPPDPPEADLRTQGAYDPRTQGFYGTYTSEPRPEDLTSGTPESGPVGPPAAAAPPLVDGQAPSLPEIPPDWRPNNGLIAMASKQLGMSRESIVEESIQFVLHHRSLDHRFARIQDAWWKWMHNAKPGGKFASQARRGSGPVSSLGHHPIPQTRADWGWT